MKTRIISVVILLISVLGFLSFKNSTDESEPYSAIVTLMNGKGDNEGFVITYSDGTVEKKPYNIKLGFSEEYIQLQLKATAVIGEMNKKGYTFKGTYQSVGYAPAGSNILTPAYMIFEKK